MKLIQCHIKMDCYKVTKLAARAHTLILILILRLHLGQEGQFDDDIIATMSAHTIYGLLYHVILKQMRMS